jgi:hypothetical protein
MTAGMAANVSAPTVEQGLDQRELRTLMGAAAYQARRVARTLKLSQSEREDAEQESCWRCWNADGSSILRAVSGAHLPIASPGKRHSRWLMLSPPRAGLMPFHWASRRSRGCCDKRST